MGSRQLVTISATANETWKGARDTQHRNPAMLEGAANGGELGELGVGL